MTNGMTKISGTDIEYRRITTPRAAAIAGILFGLLFGASLVLLRSAIHAAVSTDTSWAQTGAWPWQKKQTSAEHGGYPE